MAKMSDHTGTRAVEIVFIHKYPIHTGYPQCSVRLSHKCLVFSQSLMSSWVSASSTSFKSLPPSDLSLHNCLYLQDQSHCHQSEICQICQKDLRVHFGPDTKNYTVRCILNSMLFPVDSTYEILGSISSVSTFGTTIIILNDMDIAYNLLEKRSATYSCRPTSVFGGEMFVYIPSLRYPRLIFWRYSHQGRL